jgi:hypothetical protein
MSDDILKIIPQDPNFVPDRAAISAAERFLRQSGFILDAHVLSNDIEFVDCGGNLESISCPFCGHQLESEWWREAMDHSYESRFKNRTLLLPCCNQESTLDKLTYHWPMGFARFVIRLRNPVEAWTQENIAQLETLLKTPLKEIWAHY